MHRIIPTLALAVAACGRPGAPSEPSEPGGPQTTPTAEAPAPSSCVEVLPDRLDFGEVPVDGGSTFVYSVTVRSTCDQGVSVRSFGPDSGEWLFDVFETVGPTQLEGRGDTYEILVRPTPPGYRTYTDAMFLTTETQGRFTESLVPLTVTGVCESLLRDEDRDGDTIPDACDRCPDAHDSQDADRDGVADPCDRCSGFDDLADIDGDTMPDACDACPGFDDRIDVDSDSIPDACDVCPLGPNWLDDDGDGTPDACDLCPGEDDRIDTNFNGIPDACEP